MKKKTVNSDKKTKIISDYNTSFQYYDQRYKKIQASKYATFFEEINIQKNILDAGCGTGLFLEYMLENIRNFNNISARVRYTGVDISLNMLKRFHVKLESLGLPKSVALVLADIENLPFRENTFNEIFAITVFQNLTDIKLGLDNLVRVGVNKFDIIISIIKKATEFEKFNNIVKKILKNFDFDHNHSLEDDIFWGTIIKKGK